MIRNKLLVLCVILILFVSVVNGATVSNAIVDTINEDVRKNFEQTLDQQAEKVVEVVSEIRSNALSLCNDVNLQTILRSTVDGSYVDFSTAEIQDYLQKIDKDTYRSGFESIELIALCGETLRSWNVSEATLQDKNEYFTTGWYQRSQSNPGDIFFNYGSNGDVFLIKAVYDRNDWNRILGFISLKLNLYSLSSAMHSQQGSLFLFNGQKQLVYPFVDYYNIAKQPDLFISGIKSIKNKQYLSLTRTIPMSDWVIVGLISTDDLYSKSHSTLTIFWSIAAIAIVFAVLIAIYLSNSITKPLMRITNKMKEAENGDIVPVSLENSYSGEVKILYESYNSMATRINTLINEVYIAKIEEQEAELKALQAQINPHFIYNTLDTINWMAAKYKAKEIQNMIYLLATMLRCSLNNGENEISIEGELQQLKSYLDIHKIRDPDRFQVIYDIDETLLQYPIIKLILQPLVENAIQHGFGDIDYMGTIWINIYKENENIVLEVINDGQKPDLEKIKKIIAPNQSEKPKSYGIRNVNTRLIKHYGIDHALQYAYKENKTYATIKIPIEKSKTQKDPLKDIIDQF